MFFRRVGSLSRILVWSMSPVANLMLLFILYAGFVIPTDYMRTWLGWLRWVNLNPIGLYSGVLYLSNATSSPSIRGRNSVCTTIVPSGTRYGRKTTNGQIFSTVGKVISVSRG